VCGVREEGLGRRLDTGLNTLGSLWIKSLGSLLLWTLGCGQSSLKFTRLWTEFTVDTGLWTLGSPGYGLWTLGRGHKVYQGVDTRFTGVWFVDTGSCTQGLPGCGH
jgi:hypothetical protein